MKLVEGGHVDWILASARDTQQQARAMLGEVLVGGRAHGLHHMCIDVGLRELLCKLLVALLLARARDAPAGGCARAAVRISHAPKIFFACGAQPVSKVS